MAKTNKKKAIWSGIVKIQMSLFPLGERFFLYNEDRTIENEFPYSEKLAGLMPKDVYKIYHFAWLDEKHVLNIEGPAPEQDW